MGYTTDFTGSLRLDRALTAAEAGELDAIHADPAAVRGPHPRGQCQWVATHDLCGIAWDDGEKFREYVEWMQWLCRWLTAHGITAAGDIAWQGEDPADRGVLRVRANVVTAEATPGPAEPPHPAQPRLDAFTDDVARLAQAARAQGKRGFAMPAGLQAELSAITADIMGRERAKSAKRLVAHCAQDLAGVRHRIVDDLAEIPPGGAFFVHMPHSAPSRRALTALGARLAGADLLLHVVDLERHDHQTVMAGLAILPTTNGECGRRAAPGADTPPYATFTGDAERFGESCARAVGLPARPIPAMDALRFRRHCAEHLGAMPKPAEIIPDQVDDLAGVRPGEPVFLHTPGSGPSGIGLAMAFNALRKHDPKSRGPGLRIIDASRFSPADLERALGHAAHGWGECGFSGTDRWTSCAGRPPMEWRLAYQGLLAGPA
jgi:hypothetical protein